MRYNSNCLRAREGTMSGTEIVNKARQWLNNQSLKYAEILASEKAALPKKKNAQRELAEIHAANQALELAKKPSTVRQPVIAFPTSRHSPNPEDI